MDWERISELSLYGKLTVLCYAISLLIEEGKATIEDIHWYRMSRKVIEKLRELVRLMAA